METLTLHTEPSRAEPSRAEPSRVESNQTERDGARSLMDVCFLLA